MSDTSRFPWSTQKQRSDNVPVAKSHFMLCAWLLGFASVAFSALTVTARSQLWLGPQTLILGAVGVCMGISIALCARRLSLTTGADLFDRLILRPRAMIAV